MFNRVPGTDRRLVGPRVASYATRGPLGKRFNKMAARLLASLSQNLGDVHHTNRFFLPANQPVQVHQA